MAVRLFTGPVELRSRPVVAMLEVSRWQTSTLAGLRTLVAWILAAIVRAGLPMPLTSVSRERVLTTFGVMRPLVVLTMIVFVGVDRP